MRSIFIALCVYVIAALTLAAVCSGDKHDDGHHVEFGFDLLKPNHYDVHKTCKDMEKIAREITCKRVAENPALAAKLLRLHYHDCFVRGCDASILLDHVDGKEAVEKEARPNLSVSGYDVIDEIKTTLEEMCPDTVSCADIVALAARDAVSCQMRKPMWEVQTGRKDGKISLSTEAAANLPSAGANFTTLLQQFKDLGLNKLDLVTLSGAHTIGISHCGLVSRRVNNFTGKGDVDPSMDPTYADTLRTTCSANPSSELEMDPLSSLSFDSHYYVTLLQKKGLFTSDASLLTDSESAKMVAIFQNPRVFFDQFGRSMKKMGAIGVITGDDGEIRKNCRVVNA